jgi:hypothetical protein
MKNTIKANRLRCAEIIATLAEQKRNYFVNGVEQPMEIRVTLEAELARLRLETLKLVDSENAQKAQIRQRRGFKSAKTHCQPTGQAAATSTLGSLKNSSMVKLWKSKRN